MRGRQHRSTARGRFGPSRPDCVLFADAYSQRGSAWSKGGDADKGIADFNEAFQTHCSDEDFDTVGGLVINRFGRVPKRGESVIFDGFKFAVLRADSRKVHSLLVERVATAEAGQTDADGSGKKVAP